jgi:hypothetical protein
MNMRNRTAPPNYAHPLVGRGCHWLDSAGRATWQGCVAANLNDGYFLIQLTDWVTGTASQEVIVNLSELALKAAAGYSTKGGIVFYASVQEAKAYYDAVLSKIPKPK